VPLCAERLHDRIDDRLPALLALRTEAIRMTPNAPRVPLLLDKRRGGIKRITALRAEEVTNMPLGAARHDHLAFDRGLAALAARGKQLVEVKVAVEPQRLVEPVFGLETLHVGRCWVGGQELDVLSAQARAHPGYALGVLVVGLWVEGHAFEMLAAVVALETFGVEAQSCCGDDAAGDGERALGALDAGADTACWGPV